MTLTRFEFKTGFFIKATEIPIFTQSIGYANGV